MERKQTIHPIMKKASGLLATALAVSPLVGTTAEAAVSLINSTPSTLTVNEGQPLTIHLKDFFTSTIGGGTYTVNYVPYSGIFSSYSINDSTYDLVLYTFPHLDPTSGAFTVSANDADNAPQSLAFPFNVNVAPEGDMPNLIVPTGFTIGDNDYGLPLAYNNSGSYIFGDANDNLATITFSAPSGTHVTLGTYTPFSSSARYLSISADSTPVSTTTFTAVATDTEGLSVSSSFGVQSRNDLSIETNGYKVFNLAALLGSSYNSNLNYTVDHYRSYNYYGEITESGNLLISPDLLKEGKGYVWLHGSPKSETSPYAAEDTVIFFNVVSSSHVIHAFPSDYSAEFATVAGDNLDFSIIRPSWFGSGAVYLVPTSKLVGDISVDKLENSKIASDPIPYIEGGWYFNSLPIPETAPTDTYKVYLVSGNQYAEAPETFRIYNTLEGGDIYSNYEQDGRVDIGGVARFINAHPQIVTEAYDIKLLLDTLIRPIVAVEGDYR